METLQTTIDLVQSRAGRPPLVVLNAVSSQGTRHEQAKEAIKVTGTAVCPALIGQRVAFEYAAQLGQSAAEFEPSGKAASEIRHLYKFISRILDTSTTGDSTHDEKTQFG